MNWSRFATGSIPFAIVFQAIRQFLEPSLVKEKKITGFRVYDDEKKD